MRGVAVLLLGAVALFCGFGWMATFEPGDHTAWRIGYGAVGVAALAGAAYFLVSNGTSREH